MIRKHLLQWLGLSGLMLSLAACETPKPLIPTTSTSSCANWHDIYYHAESDSPATIEAIRKNNAAHDAVCPPGT